MVKKVPVDKFLAALEHRRKPEIITLRAAILKSNDGITEQVKWNAPSFCWKNDDRVTMRLQPGDRVELVFHRGAKIKSASGINFIDPTKMIVWAAADRGVITIKSSSELDGLLGDIVILVNAWMKATE